MKHILPLLSIFLFASVSLAKDKPNILWLITDNCNLD
ncbi:uncharacterized protein METZ01_LOCUS433009, partial [marine metagenome]